MAVIRIRCRSKHAEITVPKGRVEPSCETKLKLIAWLISDVGLKLGVEEIELAYEADDSASEAW